MRFAVVMKNFVQVFAGDFESVGEIVVAGGNHDLACTVVVDGALPVGRGYAKITVLTRNRLYPFVLPDVQLKVLGDTAVIFERFQPRRLSQRGGERNIANLEQLRRGEEHHVGRIVIDGIDEASLVDNQGLEARLLRFDGAGHARGTSAHDQHVAPGVGPRMRLRAGQSLGNLLDRQGCQAFIARDRDRSF